MNFSNQARWERVVRGLIGLAMFASGWWLASGVVGATLRILALYPLVTAIAGWCPIYALLRFQSFDRD